MVRIFSEFSCSKAFVLECFHRVYWRHRRQVGLFGGVLCRKAPALSLSGVLSPQFCVRLILAPL